MRTKHLKFSNRSRNTTIKKIVTLLITFIVLAIIIAGYFLIKNNESLLNSTFQEFKVLTIKETFEYCFPKVNIKVDAFSTPQIVGIDEMRNIFTLYVKKNGIIIDINGRKIDNNYEQYKIIYEKALFNLLKKIEVEDYKNANMEGVFSYFSDYTYAYKQENGKEYIIISGKDKDGKNTLELWFLFRRINNNVKLFAEKVNLNGVILSDLKRTALLSELFQVNKSSIKDNLINLVKTSKLDIFLLDQHNVEIGSVLDSFEGTRWFVRDENKNLVECNILVREENSEKSLAFGLKMYKVGVVTLDYAYLNATEINLEEAYDILYELYIKSGKFDEKKYIQEIVNKIKDSLLVNTDKRISDFLKELEKDYNINWGYLIRGGIIKIVIEGNRKSSGSQFKLIYAVRGEEIRLEETYVNNKSIAPNLFATQLIKSQEFDNLASLYLSKVKDSKIVPGSSFKNNASAFESFLKNPSWSYDKNNDRVILIGSGLYGEKNRQFKFVFEVLADRTLLEYAYADDVEMIDEVRDYIISKIFKFPKLADNMLILVKNTIFNTKTYGKIFGDSGWNIDLNKDLVIFSNNNLRVTFFVEPNGDVMVKDFYYRGLNYSQMKHELIQNVEEKGLYILDTLLIKENPQKQDTSTTSTDTNDTTQEKEQEKQKENEIIYQQF